VEEPAERRRWVKEFGQAEAYLERSEREAQNKSDNRW